jgi:polar amino acid transport system substrate-binding protein
MTDSMSVVRSELAPTGTLRVALNMSNFLLTATDPVSGEPCGLAADLGRELGQRLGVPVALLPYPNPGELADAASTGVWDVGFIGAEPQRADAIDFTAAYVEIEATYLVPPGSPFQSVAEVDRPGVRIAAPARSAYELYLSRSLQHAQLTREQGAENAFKRFVTDDLDALAGLRPRLVSDQEALPGSRLLDGRFTAVQQAAGTLKGRPAGARYLYAFIEDVKATGLVARLIEKNHVRGLTVAAPA